MLRTSYSSTAYSLDNTLQKHSMNYFEDNLNGAHEKYFDCSMDLLLYPTLTMYFGNSFIIHVYLIYYEMR